MSTTPEETESDKIEVPLDLVLSQLSERGKMEWELAVTKAQLLMSQSNNASLQEQINSLLTEKD